MPRKPSPGTAESPNSSSAKPVKQQNRTRPASPAGSEDKPPRKRRQYMPAEQRRKQILEVSREVFGRLGLNGARTRDLTQAAGINQATLFEHFRSKDELFAEAVVQPLVDTIEGARDRAEAYTTATSDEDLRPLLQKGMEQNLRSMVEMYPLLLQALASDREMGEKLYREQISPLLNAQATIVKELIDDSIDPELMQLASFGIFFAVAMDQTLGEEPRDLSDVARQLVELIVYGCSAKAKKS